MPCYLFTYHAYGSWLPDRRQGYVRRGEGILPCDAKVAEQYRREMREVEARLAAEQQRCLIRVLLESTLPQAFTLYAAATDVTHLHALLGWHDGRGAVKMRALVKSSLTRGLRATYGQRTWLSEGGSRKRVRDRRHFDYLITTYLPKHAGWKWDADRGYYL